MAIKIGIVSQKGGVGKSSLAQGLATLYDDTCPPSAVLIDADPQRTTTNWSRRRPQRTPEFHAIGGKSNLAHVLRSHESSRNRVIIIDTAPTIDDLVFNIVRRCDFVLIPTGMGEFDLEAVVETVAMARDMDRHHRVILTRVPPQRSDHDAPLVRRARDELEGRGAMVWDGRIVARHAWVHASERGFAVHEHDPESAAAREMFALWRDLNDAMGIKPAAAAPMSMLTLAA